MARDFNKTSGNSNASATGAISVKLNGARGVTISLWFYCRSTNTSTTTTSDAMFRTAAGAGSGLNFGVTGAASGNERSLTARFRATSGGAYTQVTGSRVFELNSWHHACFTCDGITRMQTLYLDGIRDTMNVNGMTQEWIFQQSSVAERIGSAGTTGGADSFDGQLEHVCQYKEVLRIEEIRRLARGESPMSVRPQNLTVYYPCLVDEGTTIVDYVGGANLTITGSQPWAANGSPAMRRPIVSIPRVFKAASGTTYNESPSDAATSGDALAAAVTFASAASDSGTAADSTASAATMPNASSDSGASGDALASIATMSESDTESVTGAWTVSAGLMFNESPSAAVTSSDANTSASTLSNAVADGPTAGSSLTSLSTMAESMLWQVTSGDSPSSAFTAREALSYAAAVGDSTVGSSGFMELLADAIAAIYATDSSSSSAPASRPSRSRILAARTSRILSAKTSEIP